MSEVCENQAEIHRMDKNKSLYLPDSIEIASLEGVTLWCPEINQSNDHWHGDA